MAAIARQAARLAGRVADEEFMAAADSEMAAMAAAMEADMAADEEGRHAEEEDLIMLHVRLHVLPALQGFSTGGAALYGVAGVLPSKWGTIWWN